ncbi:MAG TPA: hypothetical protein ENJ28_12175 [Gammaproteobacteria bacterium]|nr:hypothetical protein [Gammaproteobacteria bacterium]
MKIVAILLYIFSLPMLSACSTYTIDRYSMNVDNNQAIKQILRDKKIAVDDFTSNEVKSSIICRGAGPVVVPDGKIFAQYIRKALVDELMMAGNYDSGSNIRISGVLKKVDFSSNSGTWYITITINSNKIISFDVTEEYDYRTAYFGETACMDTARAFLPATQNLIHKIINHSDFLKIIQSQ